MTPTDQKRMAKFILESVLELRRRLQARHDAGGTSIPDFAGTSIMLVLLDETSGDVRIASEEKPLSNAVAGLLNSSLPVAVAKPPTQKVVLS